MKQLSAQDASFIYQETSTSPMHVGAVSILDPSESPHGPITLQLALKTFGARLHLMPMARRRLVYVPFELDYPYWIEDENFDLEYHIREVGLPEPYDWQALYTLSARILARPLDMTRPPWEIYLIHGLDALDGMPKGCVGYLSKTHHCAIDGMSGMEMAIATADLSPEIRDVEPPSAPWQHDPVPTDFELLTRSWGNALQRPMQIAELMSQSVSRTNGLTPGMSRELPEQNVAPITRFNRGVSAHRSVGFTRYPLDTIKAIKNAVAGATVNDVALTLCAGAIRAYLEAKFELPDAPMVSMVPISVRPSDAAEAAGNNVSAMFVPIHTNIADPRERLEAVRNSTQNAKQMTEAVGADTMLKWNELVPAAVSNSAQRLTSEFARANQVTPAFNCSITNVPGPQVPLYYMGGKMVTSIGYGPVTHNMGLIIPITSYCGELVVSFTSCREMVPDPDFFMQCFTDSYDALVAAVL